MHWVMLPWATEERGQKEVSHQTAELFVQTGFGLWAVQSLFPAFQGETRKLSHTRLLNKPLKLPPYTA